ncbi:hypothetical protein CR513_49849, partial [Mucuna pruriens]
MDSPLNGNFIQFLTAKMVWDPITTTYFDGSETSQVYNLRRRGLWCEIDFHCPNPMECSTDIQHYNTLVQEDRVYVFLDGPDNCLDNIRSDVLQMKLFSKME